MTPQQKAIKEWMRKGGQATPDKPTMPDEATRILRVKLIFEEAFELAEALGVWLQHEGESCLHFCDLEFESVEDPDLTKAADATADLRVVVTGTDVALGIDGEAIDAEVQRSNDSKFEWTAAELDEAPSRGWSVHLPYEETRPGVFRVCVTDASGKIMKPPTYSKADIERLILEQKGNA